MAKKLRKGESLSLAVNKALAKDFAKYKRKVEIKVANRFKVLASEIAPDGVREKTGKKLRNILLDLKIRTDSSRSGINVNFDKSTRTVKIYLVTNSDSENSLINWTNYGTGVYGPKGRPIRPKTKPFLAWKDENGVWHRAKEVAGQPGKHYLREAGEQLEKEINSGRFNKG